MGINCTQKRDEPTTEGEGKNNIYGPGTNGFNNWVKNNRNWSDPKRHPLTPLGALPSHPEKETRSKTTSVQMIG